ncbi:hypothetical protein ACGFXC_16120 [Streptomyces sp. NPDC048507]|uniref:hypothetical protein n=1 Tax=Streptomyces sp. NPDC048507 TaxID=3365560 RepID=UPI003712C241
MTDEVTSGERGTGAEPGGSGAGAGSGGGGDRAGAAELVRVCDEAGRPRGGGFVADDRGTVITSHAAVDGPAPVVLHGPGDRRWPARPADVTALPELGLALVRTDGLGLRPLPVAMREVIAPGTYVRLPARGWRQARVLMAGAEVTYTAADRAHLLPATVELAIGTDGRDALRHGGGACGGPVLDADTGAVLAVLGTALAPEHRSGSFAVPLRAAAAAAPGGPLADLLQRNSATVPGYGADLNLAGALELTAITLGSAFPAAVGAGPAPQPVHRPGIAAGLAAFTAGDRPVLGLVGLPGTGRTTALAALAADRARGPRPAPTLWLRGADLRAGDASLADAVTRALAAAARIVGAGGGGPVERSTAERVAGLAGAAGRALLVVLDGPEEMPPELAHRLGPWTAATAGWLRGTGTRLVVAARPEYWEGAGALYPPGALHTPDRPARRLPPALPVADLTPAEAATARARLGIPDDAVRAADARHPLTLSLLAGIRAAEVTAGRPGRDEVFAAHLDLVALRVAVRIAAAADDDRRPPTGAWPGGGVGRAGTPRPGSGASAGGAAPGGPGDLGHPGGPGAAASRGAGRGDPDPGCSRGPGGAAGCGGTGGGGCASEGGAGCAGPGGPGHRGAPDPEPAGESGGAAGSWGRVASGAPRDPAAGGAGAGSQRSDRAGHEGGAGAGGGGGGAEDPGGVAGFWDTAASGAPRDPAGAGAGAGNSGGTAGSARSDLSGYAAAAGARGAEGVGGAGRAWGAGRDGGALTVGGTGGAGRAGTGGGAEGVGWAGGAGCAGTVGGAEDVGRADGDRSVGAAEGAGSAGTGRGAEGAGADTESESARGRVDAGGSGRTGFQDPADRGSPGEAGAMSEGPGAGWDGGFDGAGAGSGIAGSGAGCNGLGASEGGGFEGSGAGAGAGFAGSGAGCNGPGAGSGGGFVAAGAGRGGGFEEVGGGRVYGPGVRRLAVRVAGRVHEAARRCLGPGQGQLDRAAFEELFPWRTGWASAVLTEGLLVPAGAGYRFAHEEFADWLQAGHLDVPTALDALVHHGPATPGPPVPRHRAGPVLEALRRLPAPEVRSCLTRLVGALNAFTEHGPVHPDRVWWAARLLRGTLLGAADAAPQLPVLHALAEHVARAGPGAFDGRFWNRLRLPESDRLDLLRRLLPSDHHYLEAAARRLARSPQLVLPLICAWFTDERRLRGRPGATVATAAQALLHTHRALAVDDLAEALVRAAHPRADELLAVLAEDEPSALSRAVDRWAHDERPGRRVAAAAYGLATAPHVRTPADRELLRHAAQALLARPGDVTLHGSALAVLLRDPQVRARYLPEALDCFRDPAHGSRLPATALVAALPVLPDQDAVFAALRARADGEVLRALAALTTPGLARRAADLVREHLAARPEDAPHAAAFADRRLEQGPAAGPVLRPLVLDWLRTAPPPVRAELARVLAAPGGEPSRTLRGELAGVLLREEPDPAVLGAFLEALAAATPARPEERTRELLRRTGRRLLCLPGGPAVFEHRTVGLARTEPAFGALVGRWLADAGAEAAALLGPGARRTLEGLSRTAPEVT